ncbi:hypothetical protein CL689_00955 [Candidatus Saccharibacteria bacterium]|mgnify:FL=1|nr:hypothetical protein [Candidatus Saccharibacteria bacterium]MBJ58765.1 hypothetical protein [Candidatus Saccharibacteria bacterium]MBQ68618.1 hypothetical protein [Candidatus Saccharibacteria bacterium]|tara:strand:- start:367 stop:1350 length:984 start_codon:yes stop_codon:yes gene_type:complete
MAEYKVPQDVEADDKLIGPFSFRQFIYLIIVALAGAAAWGLSQIFIGLAIIPLPIILLFGILALPLRKDQPMEIYFAAIVSFYIKPRKRLWDPEGVESLIEITVPKTVEVKLTKDITEADAEQRFTYLANLVDTGGWAIRGVGAPGNTPMNTDAFYEAQNTEDVLDTNTDVARSFDRLMEQRTAKLKQEARDHMLHPQPVATPAPQPAQAVAQPQVQSVPQPAEPTLSYNPYPDIRQTVIQPIDDPTHQYQAPQSAQPQAATPEPAAPTPPEPAEPQPATSSNPVSADIMNLANNTDLSIETIAREAHRIEQKKEHELTDEVVISLR